MNDYLNHKWRNFLNEDKKPARRNVLNETSAEPQYGERRGKTIKAKVEEKVLPIPYPSISANWGKPGNADRAEVESLLARVATGTTWQAKIKNLNIFVESCKGAEVCLKQADSTILSKLMALDIIVSIVYDFDPATSGFLFESLMATLIGGTSEQVAASQSRTGEQTGDISDVILLNKPFSLKLLRKKASSIDGSYGDLIGSIIKHQQPISYLVALKETDTELPVIRFYEFTIGSSAVVQDEAGDWVHDLSRVGEGPYGGYVDVDNPDLKVIKGTEFHVPTAILKKTTGKMSVKKKGQKKGGKEVDPQLVRRQKAFQAMEFSKETEVLNIGTKESLETLANAYTKQIHEDITTIYNSLESLTKNINSYIIGSKVSAGETAKTDAGRVYRKTTKLISDREGE